MTEAGQRLLCTSLADLLSYPVPGIAGVARRARALARGSGPTETALSAFCRHTEEMELSELQELYTSTFDLQPACAPYLGHQLVGDSPMRGPLLSRLAELYAEEGFRPRGELADHVAEVLRFLAAARPGETRDDLARDGLVPAVEKMVESLGAEPNPYRDLLQAVHEAFDSPAELRRDAAVS